MLALAVSAIAAGWLSDQARCLIVNNDGFSDFFSGYLSDQESIDRYVEKYADTKVGILEWCINGSRVNYRSTVAELIGHGCMEFPRRGDQRAVEAYRRLAEQGTDLLAAVADACHKKANIECFASIRAACEYPTGWMGELLPRMFNASIWWTHPEWRVRGPRGEDWTKLSYAVPQVMSFKLALVREVLERDIDGINIDFLRHPPFVGYEQPVAEEFQRRHGQPLEGVPSSDPRLQQIWCDVMTRFMHGVRELARQAAERRGRPVRVSVRIDHSHGRDWGLDVERWCAERLIDILEIGQHSLGGYDMGLRPFVKMAHANGVLVYASEEAVLSGHDLTPEEDKAIAEGKMKPPERDVMTRDMYFDRAKRWYEQGADGVHIFNDPHNFDVFRAWPCPPEGGAGR
ncbi:MAG: hypothetical protein H5T86_10480 [Armatimonadetes bacterium]|nr:hypothetical protein [Armatimonadota bacterium]